MEGIQGAVENVKDLEHELSRGFESRRGEEPVSGYLSVWLAWQYWAGISRTTHKGGVGASSAREASEVIRELLEMLGTAASSANTGGSSTGLVYTAELLMTHALEVEL